MPKRTRRRGPPNGEAPEKVETPAQRTDDTPEEQPDEPAPHAPAEPAAAAPTEPAEPTPPPEPPPLKKDDVRDSIAANWREQRQAEVEADAQDEQVGELEDYAGAEEDEDDDAEPPAAAPTTAAETPLQQLAKGAQAVTISVYGKERNATRAEVLAVGARVAGKDASEQTRLETGLRELQIGEAADHRMRQASTREAQLDQRENELRAREQRLSAAPTPPPAPPPAPPPQAGVSDADLRAAIKERTQAYFGGDMAAAEAAELKVTEMLLKRAPAAVTITPDYVQNVVQHTLADAPRVEANRVFREEFPDLETDQLARMVTLRQFGELASDPEWGTKALPDRMREAGNRARGAIARMNGTPAPAPTPPRSGGPAPRNPGPVVSRTRLSAKAAASLAAAGGLSTRPRAAPQAPAKTNSDVVADIRKSRFQD